MQKMDLELYTDYLLSTCGAATATGLSAMLEGEISHDRITRFLAERDYKIAPDRATSDCAFLATSPPS